MDSGFISLHRKMRKAVWYGKPEYVAAWVHMLFKANYKDTEVMHGNQVIKLKRGQFISGRKALSSEIGVSEQRLRSILKSFKTNQQIDQQSFSKYSVFTVVNYDDYQLNNQQENQQTTSKQPTNNQQATTENKVNKVNKDNKKENKHAALAQKLDVDLSLIERIVKHRRDIKRPANTDKKITLVIDNFKKCVEQGFFKNLDEAMSKLDTTEWQTLKPEYLGSKQNRFTNPVDARQQAIDDFVSSRGVVSEQ